MVAVQQPRRELGSAKLAACNSESHYSPEPLDLLKAIASAKAGRAQPPNTGAILSYFSGLPLRRHAAIAPLVCLAGREAGRDDPVA